MEFRIAVPADLPALTRLYQGIVETMCRQGIQMWDDVYPVCCLGEDISHHCLYLLEDEGELLAAFSLEWDEEGDSRLGWPFPGKSVYLERLGVSPEHSRQGIGSHMLTLAKKTAAELGAENLRLFTVDSNLPAIAFYEKHGWSKARGIYLDRIDDEKILRLCGYSCRLAK